MRNSDKPKPHLTVNIKVEPRSSRSGIVGAYGDGLKVRLTSPPVEGRANKELIEVLAKEFGIPKKDIEIISGESSKRKIVRLTGVRSIEDRK
ncbi:MAG: DUF167 domain-containing protein [Nitrospirota bacterium]|nr:DUF167 domain-containing protein [Nitrospirota bacterium]